MKAGRTRAAIVLGVAVLGIWMAGCDWGGDDDPEWPPSATKILEVRVDPNPVVAGDTTTFTYIVTDSLDTDLEFTWIFSGGSFESAVTDTNQYRWMAPDQVKTYRHQVRVSRPPGAGAGFEDAVKEFDVGVIDPE